MERIQILINKLKEQLETKASPTQMLVTVKMLQNELTQAQVTGQHTLGTSKVAVVLPKTMNFTMEEMVEVEEKEAPTYNAVSTPIPTPAPASTPIPAKKPEPAHLLFDPLVEIPTLSHQQGVKEINEISDLSESVNDRLKQEKVEVAELLRHEPIKDLRKAIGINDRFVFINDLFRGDEAMYERSIKTINGFNIFPEAEYWINRELIVKLGWDADNEIVRHFYELVRRRFS